MCSLLCSVSLSLCMLFVCEMTSDLFDIFQKKQQKKQQLSAIQSLVEVEKEVKEVLNILGLLSSSTYLEVIWFLASENGI